MHGIQALMAENTALKAERDALQVTLAEWQRFASYCHCCAKSGEHELQDFETFTAEQRRRAAVIAAIE